MKVRGSVVSKHSPVLHGSKGLLVGNIIHEQEAHGSAVVGCGDGTVALLARRVLAHSEVRHLEATPFPTLPLQVGTPASQSQSDDQDMDLPSQLPIQWGEIWACSSLMKGTCILSLRGFQSEGLVASQRRISPL